MPDKKQDDYSVSTIIKHPAHYDPFEALIDYFKTQDNVNNINLKKNQLINNPSFKLINLEGESIKIEDVRDFNQELSFSGYDNNKRYFIFFNADKITQQAQNAILKSLEEPPKNTQIIFLTSLLDQLLPTIISRCRVITFKKYSKKADFEKISREYQKIINSKHYELLELAKKYKDKTQALLFLDNLLSFLHSELNNKTSIYKKNQLSKHLKISLLAMKQLNQNANTKLVIENYLFNFVSIFLR